MLDVHVARVEAVFASSLQPSDEPTGEQIRYTIATIARTRGCRCCAEIVATEFGEHPEAAVERMRWARDVVNGLYPRRQR